MYLYNIIVLVLLNLEMASAQAPKKPNQLCWKKEINYKTGKIYKSEALYKQHKTHWASYNKITPDPVSLGTAYMTYQSEIKKTEKFSKKDKVKHCYMGCRISAETDLETAQYVAWKKEQDDITDCRVSTHFEMTDYQATLDGARQASTADVCEKYCLTHW